MLLHAFSGSIFPISYIFINSLLLVASITHLDGSQWVILFFNFFWQQNNLYSYFSNNNNNINNNSRTVKESERRENEEFFIISLLSKHVLRKAFDIRHYCCEFKLICYPFLRNFILNSGRKKLSLLELLQFLPNKWF